jgi:uncharacterized protein YbaP (TraB family)
MNGLFRFLFTTVGVLCCFLVATAQSANQKNEKKYTSLLWEISGNGLKKPSYLFGTMHISNKLVFHLSDSFFLAIKNADVVGLELNSDTWQDEMIDVEKQQKIFNNFYNNGASNNVYYGTVAASSFGPGYNVINDKTYTTEIDYMPLLKSALKEMPYLVNALLYRNREYTQDFEENTFLDMYIYQTGKKLGKKSAGMETLYTMEKYVTEAEIARAKEKRKNNYKDRSRDDFPDMSADEAYRKGDLDMLDSIDRIYYNSSEAYTEKFLYQRNDVQAHSMDTIMKKGQSLFVGVGAAHLPGKRGVIEILRKMGYTLRPVKMLNRDAAIREKIDKIRVPVNFVDNTTEDGFITMRVPGKMYNQKSYNRNGADLQYCDMSNGTYYMLTRVPTASFYYNESAARTLKKMDSILYENIPGKILYKKKISKQGYDGFDIVNRTRKGDVQRYNIFVTPFEILIFKISGIENYIQLGTEANTFFNSISFANTEKNNYSLLKVNDITVSLPTHRYVYSDMSTAFVQAFDVPRRLQYLVQKDNKGDEIAFPSDLFMLELQEKSLLNAYKKYEVVHRKIETIGNKKQLLGSYKFKDSFLFAKMMIVGNHAYMISVKGPSKEGVFNNKSVLDLSVNKSTEKPAVTYVDTFLNFSVKTPCYPQIVDSLKALWNKATDAGSSYSYYANADEEYSYYNTQTYKTMYFTNPQDGETIRVNFNKDLKYAYGADSLFVYKQFRDSMEKVLNNPEKLAYIVDSMYYARNYNNDFEKYNKFKVSKKLFRNAQGYSVEESIVYDTATSVKTMEKTFTKDNISFMLSANVSTSQTSDFVQTFFTSFQPLYDRLKTVPYFGSKIDAFFADYYSKDTATFKTARGAVTSVSFEKKDIPRMIKAYQSLTLKDKDYFDMKLSWINAIAALKDSTSNEEIVRFLKSVYESAGDTALLQNKALQKLRDLKTKEAMLAFKNYILQDPPLTADNDSYNRYDYYRYTTYGSKGDGDFASNIFAMDSLELAKLLFPELLQLASIKDYENEVLNLLSTLVDSNKISTKEYEAHLTKIMFDAKLALKRKQLAEQNTVISKQSVDLDDENNLLETSAAATKDNYYSSYNNEGDVVRLVKLMLPFYEKNAAIPPFINKIFALKDDRLKYGLMFIMLKAGKPIPDTLVHYFAKREVDRGALYYALSKLKKQNIFPKEFLNTDDMAKAFLYTSIADQDKVDSMQKIFLAKLYRLDSAAVAKYFKQGEHAVDQYGEFASRWTSFPYSSDYYDTYYGGGDNVEIASEKLDTIVLIRKELTTINLSIGYLYIYKYKKKKADKWRLAFSGLQPTDGSISVHNIATRLTDEKLTDDEPLEDFIQRQVEKLKTILHPWSRRFYTESYKGYGYIHHDY